MATTNYTIVPARPEHVAQIAARVRQADVEELRAAAAVTPTRAMEMGLSGSCEVWVALAGETPLCMFGITPLSSVTGVGIPWMVGTEDIDLHARGFLRYSRPTLETLLDRWPVLLNYVDIRNTKAIRWLRWIGFEMKETVPYGTFGFKFTRFERGSARCATTN